MKARILRFVCVVATTTCLSCQSDQPTVAGPSPSPPVVPASPAPAPSPAPGTPTTVTTDAQLFALIATTDPFAAYRLFPNADEIASGSSAHQPLVRTSMNAIAFSALQNGRLPAGAKFPDGSVVFKEVRANAEGTTTYAVMFKSTSSPHAGGGWLWAELNPNGTIGYSISNRGSGCVGCHSLGLGLQNDPVRTFERQH